MWSPRWAKDGSPTCYPRPDLLEESKRRFYTQYTFSNGEDGEDGQREWSVLMTGDVMLSVSLEHLSLAPTSTAPRTATSSFYCLENFSKLGYESLGGVSE